MNRCICGDRDTAIHGWCVYSTDGELVSSVGGCKFPRQPGQRAMET
jgi:hypothetical protein